MKFFLITTMLLSTSLYALTPEAGLYGYGYAPTGYAPNDGKIPPGTFNSKSTKGKAPAAADVSSPVTTESGITNSSGVTTDQMNTSPNAAPTTDAEAQQDTTLSSGGVLETGPYTREGTFNPRKPEEIEAQEENALDYSTTPKKRTTTPLGPNKK